nr:uncharacterized protein LOC129387908 isoform X1 [Dermacentor andersoni]
MVKCFVPYCRSGYKSCKEKNSLFKPPQDDARLEAWRRAIPRKDRVLQRTDRVCERHFAPHFILKTWSAEVDGHVLMSGKRRAGLTKDAIPSIFEGASSYISKQSKSPRKTAKRLSGRAASSASQQSSSIVGSRLLADMTQPVASSDESDCVAKSCEASPFETLNEVGSICLPQHSWAAHRTDIEEERKKEPASCCTHGKSTKPVQTEASWLFSSSVDVAVETPRIIDVSKSTQTSPVAVKVHMWTETTDLVESKDSDTHLPELLAPYMCGMPRLTNKNEIPKVATLYFIK